MFSDFGVKYMLGQEARQKYLIDFLNSFLQLPKPIVKVTLLNPEKIGNRRKSRKAVFDIYCEDTEGNKFIVEIQRLKKRFFFERTVFYSTFAVQEYAIKGEWDFNIKCTYVISILDFSLDNTEKDQFIHPVKLVDTESNKVFGENLQYLYIEIPKFNKRIDELVTRMDKWLYIFKNMDTFEKIPEPFQSDPIFKEFFMDAEVANFDRDAMMEYYANMKEIWDKYSLEQTILYNEEQAQLKIEQTKLKFAQFLLNNTKYSIEQIAEQIEAPIDFVIKAKEDIFRFCK